MFHYRVAIKFTKGLILKDKFTISGTPIPEFVGAVENVTVPVGRDAIFTCNVKNLGRFKVRKHQFHQHFTSSFFCIKLFCKAFKYFLYGLFIFWWKEIGETDAHKMLVKLTEGVNFTNILQAAFSPIFIRWENFKLKL